jgi:hypothetical protein
MDAEKVGVGAQGAGTGVVRVEVLVGVVLASMTR